VRPKVIDFGGVILYWFDFGVGDSVNFAYTYHLMKITLDNISYTHSSRQNGGVKNISLELERGKILSIYGASGSGKSTLIQILSG
jgi:ABC-type bacteriocin/lantibiotic exporter with double-glycine peptidase domain